MPGPSEFEQRLAEYERETQRFQMRVKELEEELVAAKRRLHEAPRRIRQLEEHLADSKTQLMAALARNEKLSATLHGARDNIAALREEILRLTQPPSAYAVLVGLNQDGTADISLAGRKLKVALDPKLHPDDCVVGSEVSLNDSNAIISIRDQDRTGSIGTFRDLLDDGQRVVVGVTGDEEVVCTLVEPLLDHRFRPGDRVLIDSRSSLVLDVLPRPEVDELSLEEVPDVSYSDIGGLDNQIEAIQDAVELPFVHHELYREHDLQPPKGVLLYGPPGCGKTLIAKAIARSLAHRVAQTTGTEVPRSYFINIKGPELLNKYVGETERKIRLIFERAREKAADGSPVVVFFDEMDSLFRTRGTGISSDIESTIVPQLLAEIDGVEGLRNVLVVGASNREDLIDPAILRPGRLDVKIKIERPDRKAATAIFAKYMHDQLPISSSELSGGVDRQSAVAQMIEAAVERMYALDDANRFLEVRYQNGDRDVLYFKDFSSGAMIENIVRRAKQRAIKRQIASGEPGICTEDLVASVAQEFREHEDLPNTTNPDDWAKISGQKGERIVYVRTLVGDGGRTSGGRTIESAPTGQYL